jgi:hypothetical protein
MRFHLVIVCIAMAFVAIDAGGWGSSCRNATIDIFECRNVWYANLEAKCKKVDGRYISTSLRLGDYIINHGGNLTVCLRLSINHYFSFTI